MQLYYFSVSMQHWRGMVELGSLMQDFPSASCGTNTTLAAELLAEAAADPHKELRAELDGLKLSELKKRARGAGVDGDALDEADDEDDVRAAVVALLLAAAGAPKL